MASAAREFSPVWPWRFSRSDATLVILAVVHGAALVAFPSAILIAAGIWWNSNTIAHNFIHRPFFRRAAWNRVFSAAQSMLLGIPQTLWRDRHLAHHAGVPWRLRLSRWLMAETALVAGLWMFLAMKQPRFFLLVYLPGYLAGLGLCWMQGYWEHAGGQPVSHYGRLYNFLCFNDGHHSEHHANPAIHWTSLPSAVKHGTRESRWPALLRWLDVSPLEGLERAVLRSVLLQRLVLRCHRAVFAKLLAEVPAVARVTIIGGALYPRTALILRELLPVAQLTIVDSNSANLEIAQRFLGDSVQYRHQSYRPGERLDCDLTVIPLCLWGDRGAIYRDPPSPAVLIHDWIWHSSGNGAVVSLLLLKRLNLVRR